MPTVLSLHHPEVRSRPFAASSVCGDGLLSETPLHRKGLTLWASGHTRGGGVARPFVAD